MFITNADPSWQQGRLSDLITVRYGKDHKKLADGMYPVYGSGGIMRYAERPLYEHESVFIPRKGTLNNVMYVNEPFWSVDTMFYTEMRVPNVAKFVYHFVKSKDLASMNAGSAVPSMTTDILNAMELSIPSATALAEFEDIVAPMYTDRLSFGLLEGICTVNTNLIRADLTALSALDAKLFFAANTWVIRFNRHPNG